MAHLRDLVRGGYGYFGVNNVGQGQLVPLIPTHPLLATTVGGQGLGRVHPRTAGRASGEKTPRTGGPPDSGQGGR